MGKIGMDRRKFLAALSMGTAHVLLSKPSFAARGRVYSGNPLEKVRLGNSGLETTMLGFGTGVHAGNRQAFLTRQSADKSIALLRHAYDRGFRNFDCADTYGTHGLLAEAMKKMDRDELTLTSKIWFRKGGIPEPERPDADIVVERLRKELKTDVIDLVQIHCMTDENWTETMADQMDILENLKAKGVIRAHGVSVHSLEAMKDAVKSPWVDVVHVRINPYGIAMDKPNPEEVVEVIHDLKKAGKGIIGMKLVGNGKLKDDSEKIDNSIRFVFGLESVDMVIIGFESEKEIDNYITRVENGLIKINRS